MIGNEHFFSLGGDNRTRMGIPKSPSAIQQARASRKKETKEYRKARVEALRRLYAENGPPMERLITYEHPTDGRKNKYEWDTLEPNPYSPFDDLKELEKEMPDIFDFF
jgi:hypothetical protein